MEKYTLKSMTDFILEHPATTDYEWQLSNHLRYANFLQQPLKLGMFIPCDENDKPLEEPIISEFLLDRPNGTPIKSKNTPEAYKYRKAKERVLFKGFELVEKREVYDSIKGSLIDLESRTFQIEGSFGVGYLTNETIGDLVSLELELTESAVKQFLDK